MKEGTRDECRTCGRLIEWASAPYEIDDNDNDIRPYWRRRPQWVDVDPPGIEVWNPHCNVEEGISTGSHEPKRYCNGKRQDGDPCNVKINDDTEGLGVCKRHLPAARVKARRQAERAERQLHERWEKESYTARVQELKKSHLYVYPPQGSYVPANLQQWGVLVDATGLLNYIEGLQLELEELKREINGDKGEG